MKVYILLAIFILLQNIAASGQKAATGTLVIAIKTPDSVIIGVDRMKGRESDSSITASKILHSPPYIIIPVGLYWHDVIQQLDSVNRNSPLSIDEFVNMYTSKISTYLLKYYFTDSVRYDRFFSSTKRMHLVFSAVASDPDTIVTYAAIIRNLSERHEPPVLVHETKPLFENAQEPVVTIMLGTYDSAMAAYHDPQVWKYGVVPGILRLMGFQEEATPKIVGFPVDILCLNENGKVRWDTFTKDSPEYIPYKKPQ